MTIRTWLKPMVGRDRPIWAIVRSVRLRRRLFPDVLDNVVYGLIVSLPRVRFIQIGSNDGILGDPLWSFRRFPNWCGILVEPIDYLYRRLVANYSPWAERFKFENAAITLTPRPFHYLTEGDGSIGFDQLFGTFDRELLLRHAQRVAGAHERLITAPVNCLTFSELCHKHEVRSLDLLHIDAEGSDAEIVQQVDLERLRPSVLLYEHINLSELDQASVSRHLDGAGYELRTVGGDTLAVRTDAVARFPALRLAWRASEETD